MTSLKLLLRFAIVGGLALLLLIPLLLIRGTARATDLYTPGCMVNVTVHTPVKEILYGILAHGIPHHYSIVWEDVADVLRQFAAILHIEVIEY